MKKLIYIGIPVFIITLLAVSYLKNKYDEDKNMLDRPKLTELVARGNGNNKTTISRGNCLSEECLAVSDLEYPVAELPNSVVAALNKALDDEYKAYSTYDVVIDKFGSIRPFIMIIRAEEQHISSLKSIYDKYGLVIPENPYVGQLSAPNTLNEACAIGVQAEIDNAALYREDLLPVVKDYEDITLVFNSLMDASQTKHLPSFERCSN